MNISRNLFEVRVYTVNYVKGRYLPRKVRLHIHKGELSSLDGQLRIQGISYTYISKNEKCSIRIRLAFVEI